MASARLPVPLRAALDSLHQRWRVLLPSRSTRVGRFNVVEPAPWAWPSRALQRFGLGAFLALFGIIIIALLRHDYAASSLLAAAAPRHYIDATTSYQDFATASKHLVIASYTKQNVTWLNRVPSAWQVQRYFMDNKYPPSGGLTVPVNQGREAMAYLTYMIDNYHQLPDFMIFTHGHEQSWHQVEPLPAKIRALNLTALEREDYISLRCGDQMGCEKQPYIDTKYPNWEGEYHMCDFWKTILPHEPCPRYISYKCCAQHAVTRRAVLKRSRKDWIRIREPLMHDYGASKGWGEGASDWLAGMFYEKFWHVLLGTGPEYCPSIEHCEQVHFSNAIMCDQSTDITLFEGEAWKDTNCISAFDKIGRDEDPVVALRAWSREYIGRYAEMRASGGHRREDQQKALKEKKKAEAKQKQEQQERKQRLEKQKAVNLLKAEAGKNGKSFKGKGDFKDETVGGHKDDAKADTAPASRPAEPSIKDGKALEETSKDRTKLDAQGQRIDQGPSGGSAEKWRHEAQAAKALLEGDTGAEKERSP